MEGGGPLRLPLRLTPCPPPASLLKHTPRTQAQAGNVAVVADRMLQFLRTATDEHVRRDIVRKARCRCPPLAFELFF